MGTTLTNPAATGGMDYGGILSNVLNAYTQVSVARVEKETAKYNAAAAIQQASFNAPQASGFLESMGIGNSSMPGTNSRGVAVNSVGGSNIPQLALLGVAGIAAFFVIKKWCRKMLGALTSLTGGGGMSASSSASSSQDSKNQISTGTISVGGLTMAPKQVVDSDLIVKGAVIAALVFGGMFVWKKVK